MRIIEIAPLSNGAHRNQIGTFRAIPNGWAAIPDDMETANFPFGDVTVEEINGVMTVTAWTPGEIPVEPEIVPTPAEQREQAYNTERIIEWDGELLTVTEAATLWQYYAAEGSEKAGDLTALIVAAKENIRAKYPDEITEKEGADNE